MAHEVEVRDAANDRRRVSGIGTDGLDGGPGGEGARDADQGVAEEPT
jgi:hypothetical protein